MIKRIKETVTHQGIGGKEFKVDECVTKTLTPASVSEKGITEGNPACWNFMDRREDFNLDFKHKLYYVKVDGLGYIIADDEIETILEPHEDLNNIKLPDPKDFPSAGGGAGGAGAAGALASATPEIKINPIVDELEKQLYQSLGVNAEKIGTAMNSRSMFQEGGRY